MNGQYLFVIISNAFTVPNKEKSKRLCSLSAWGQTKRLRLFTEKDCVFMECSNKMRGIWTLHFPIYPCADKFANKWLQVNCFRRITWCRRSVDTSLDSTWNLLKSDLEFGFFWIVGFYFPKPLNFKLESSVDKKMVWGFVKRWIICLNPVWIGHGPTPTDLTSKHLSFCAAYSIANYASHIKLVEKSWTRN